MNTKTMPYLERTLDDDVPELRPYLRPGAKVLDIGCGPGTITLGVAEAIKPGDVVGIDLQEDMIGYASKLVEERGINNAAFRVMDVHGLDFPDDTFDVVYSHTALHGFVDPVRALREQKRVTKEGGWVIAAGVRDWGLVPRYPPCPALDQVYDACIRYSDAVREGLEPPCFHNLHAGRRCPEWFVKAGLDDLRVELKVYRVQYPGADEMGPHLIDLLPSKERDEFGWSAMFDKHYEAMIADGFIDSETLKRAREEADGWYSDPRAFHFWVFVFAAGRA